MPESEPPERVSEQCRHVIESLSNVEPETAEQTEKLQRARKLVEEVMEDDKDRHGQDPTGALIEHMEAHR